MNASFRRLCAAVIMLGLCCAMSPSAQTAQAPKAVNAPALSPNVTAEMNTPDFWIKNLKGDPDRVSYLVEIRNGKQVVVSTLPSATAF